MKRLVAGAVLLLSTGLATGCDQNEDTREFLCFASGSEAGQQYEADDLDDAERQCRQANPDRDCSCSEVGVED